MPARPSPASEPGGPPSRAEADYHLLFNLSLDLLCVAGLDGYFRRVNPSWTRVLGWTEEELLARPVADFMHPEDRARTLKARDALANGTPVRGLENRYLCKDGSYRWLAWQSVLEPSAALVFAVARDITERRQLDQEHLVMSKLESTGILAGGIAHDFNNLLANLLLNVEMVSACDPTTAEQQTYLRQARVSIQAAKALTTQLITFAEGGVAARQVTYLRNLLQQSVALALAGSSIAAECLLAPDLWPAEVDEEQIGQVIRGLVLNAREATPAGGHVRLQAENVTLPVGTVSELRAGDYLRITLSDNGSGIPAHVLPRIFDPYFSTKQRGVQKGMGLGLTICRTIVQKHGGNITVSSAPGRGTTVVCHLPATRRILPQTNAGADLAPAATSRVLIMDDEPLFREIIAHTVGKLGYEVAVAKNGEDAIALYQEARHQQRPFGVVVLDLTVRGGMGGDQAIKALQEHDPSVRAILMTGYTNQEMFRSYAGHGFKAALAKPFTVETLRLTLAEVLGNPAASS